MFSMFLTNVESYTVFSWGIDFVIDTVLATGALTLDVIATLATWGIVAYFFRYSSLAAIAASLFAPLYYLFGNQVAWTTGEPQLIALISISALLLMRHQDNITRLVLGQESKIGEKKE